MEYIDTITNKIHSMVKENIKVASFAFPGVDITRLRGKIRCLCIQQDGWSPKILKSGILFN